ncbi:MAG: prepilin peptidase, partial [Dehalococcoidia bacterium]|nr:prepilin peptidase [Dehalococcoidia bacterium]
GVGFSFLLVPALLWSHGMGLGDVKYAGLIGLVTGFPVVIAAMALAAGAAGISAIILVATGAKKRHDSMPFGPFLSAGALGALIWGPAILGWYMSLPHR